MKNFLTVKYVLKIVLGVIALIALYVVFLAVKPSAYPIHTWTPKTTMNAQFSSPKSLNNVQYLDISPYEAPEMVVIKNGWLYASVDGGTIIRLKEDGSQLEKVLHTGGMILGFEIKDNGDIYFVDATYQNGFGVLAVARADKGYQPEILVDNYQGERFGMIDALTIAQNGDIYFTDASKGVVASENDQYGAHFIGVVDAFANTQSGSVYVYRPSTGKTEKLVSGLRFANGMQLVDDEKFLLLNETFGNRVLKIDTQVRDANVGDAGVSVLVDNIPAILDNMTRSANGKIWVGMPSAYLSGLDKYADATMFRKMILNMPSAVLLKFSKGQQSHSAMAFSMDENGQVQDFYVDESGKFSRVTGVNETENRLYFQHVGHNSLLPYVEK